MRAPEVLDHRADLLVRMDNPLLRRTWVDQVTMDAMDSVKRRNAKGTIVSAVGRDEKDVRASAAANIANLWHSLREAEAYHVTPDLTQLVVYAASQLNETDQIDRTIIPTRSGIARFEGGLPFLDVRGKHIRVSWVAWGPVMANFRALGLDRHDKGEPEEVTCIWMWNDHREEPDDIYDDMVAKFGEHWESMNRLLGRWGFIGSEAMIDRARLGKAWVDPGDVKSAEVLSTGDVPQAFTNCQRLMHAFWLLLGQTVTTSRQEIPDRARRKRAQRAGLPARVTVVHLRNVKTQRAQGESLVEWSHRWVVRGFWRWQVCGPKHDLAQEVAPGTYRARIWVAPFVKGPTDKPLIINDKVYALHR